MPATALYSLRMAPAEAFGYTSGALQAAGAVLAQQTPPALIEFSLTRKDVETGSIDAVMSGRAVIVPADAAGASVTIVVDPATQFILYAVGIGLAALLVGGLLFGALGNLWLVLVLAGEGWLFWSIFSKWPADALAAIDAKMRASETVSGGVIVPPPAAASGPPKPVSAAEIADQIRHLAELRDQGHITQEEFDAKKAELLSRL